MAAYGALSSLLLTLDNILDHNDAAIPLDRGQLGALRAMANFLLLSLEDLPIHRRRTHEMEILESRIRDVAFSADDYIAEIRDRQTSPHMFFDHVASLVIFLCIFSTALYLRDIFFMTLVCIVWINWRQNCILLVRALGNLFLRNETTTSTVTQLSSTATYMASLKAEVDKIGKHIVVGMESDLEMITERLCYGSENLQTVSIVGMAGIGKTCLATRVYEGSGIHDHFDICAWTTVSQSPQSSRVLLDLIESSQLMRENFAQRGTSIRDQASRGEFLYKSLYGRRYLIVMDNVWDVKIWNDVKRFLPDEGNGSRVLLTTQLTNVARSSGCPSPHMIPFLREHESRSLLQDRVFGGEDCPDELREIRDLIVNKCAGLPLALVLISGILSRIEGTRESWASLVDSLAFDATEDGYGKCMKIVALSYKHLPRHMRPCFLYMGMFPKDFMVPVAKLAQLWAAEGFLRPDSSKSPEALAEECLEDLVKRNLILVGSWSSQGKIKSCKIHDVLRELCLDEAGKKKFLFVINNQGGVRDVAIESYLRLSIHRTHPNVLSARELGNSRAHSLVCIRTNLDYMEDNPIPQCYYLHYRRVRVLDLLTIHFTGFPSQISNLVGLRYLALTFMGPLHPYISRLPNLETIVHRDTSSDMNSLLPVEIWMMPTLRHLHVPGNGLSIPPTNGSPACVLQTLVEVINMSFGIHILGKIKSLKKLGICYDVEGRSFRGWSRHELKNLAQLIQLEKLKLRVLNLSTRPCPTDLAFPQSLRKLTLSGCKIPWGRLASTVGVLPNLEVLKLRQNACQGEEWETMEGQFGKLKTLQLEHIDDLVHWRAEGTHFPHLQCLTLESCSQLKEIPSEIGEIMTLKKIELINCHPRIVISAETIREEQEEYTGCADLLVCVSSNTL